MCELNTDSEREQIRRELVQADEYVQQLNALKTREAEITAAIRSALAGDAPEPVDIETEKRFRGELGTVRRKIHKLIQNAPRPSNLLETALMRSAPLELQDEHFAVMKAADWASRRYEHAAEQVRKWQDCAESAKYKQDHETYKNRARRWRAELADADVALRAANRRADEVRQRLLNE